MMDMIESNEVVDLKEMENLGEKDGLDDGVWTDNELYVAFDKPFRWEDETYSGIDLSGLENLTAKDLADIEKKFYRTGITSFNPENTATYAKIVAQKATGMPIEFFDQMPVREMLEVKKAVVNFFFA